MSKSLGNIYKLSELQEKWIEPLAYKLFCFSSHYRNKLNFTFEGAKASQISLNRLRQGYQNHKNGTEDVDEATIQNYEERFHSAINDDLNMPAAMGVVWEVVRNEKKSPKLAELLLKFDKVLGLKIDSMPENNTEQLPEEIQKLVEQRNVARQNKDWAESDRIRDELQAKGYTVKDTKDGTEVSKVWKTLDKHE